MCANFAHVLCSSNSPSLNTLRMCDGVKKEEEVSVFNIKNSSTV